MELGAVLQVVTGTMVHNKCQTLGKKPFTNSHTPNTERNRLTSAILPPSSSFVCIDSFTPHMSHNDNDDDDGCGGADNSPPTTGTAQQQQQQQHGKPTEGMVCLSSMEDITEEAGNYGALVDECACSVSTFCVVFSTNPLSVGFRLDVSSSSSFSSNLFISISNNHHHQPRNQSNIKPIPVYNGTRHCTNGPSLNNYWRNSSTNTCHV